jgi:RNA polymerase sigma-70 factor (ECF subfamily)
MNRLEVRDASSEPPEAEGSGPRLRDFRATVERYQQPLIRFAMRIVRDPERARDVVQDTFLRLYESDVAADDPRVGSWLYTVCRNRAIDVRRRDARLTSMESPPELAVDAANDDQQAVRQVMAEVAALPERKARVLELRYGEGHSYRQIAEMTGMSVSHVGVVIFESIRALRKQLAVVAALALLVGAGAWGWRSSRGAQSERGYFTRSQPSLPVYEPREALLPPSPEPVIGPKQEPAPSATPRLPLPSRAAPRAGARPPPPQAAPAKPMPNRVDFPSDL